jgi:cellulose biosynthesis protein BcsQ
MSADPRTGSSKQRFRVVTVSSNKGGVGKTTFACNLAIYLRAMREDIPVLLLTFDDQPMPDRMFGLEDEQPTETIVSGFRQGNLNSAIRLGQYGVHYVPTSTQVADLKPEITSQAELWRVLVQTDWNGIVIIDTKSDLEILTQNAIAASDLSIVLVSDHASLVESQKVFDLFDDWGRPHDRARMLLSLVDLRIKFREGEQRDILAVLLGEVRRLGYPLFETFISRSPSIEALYTNPDDSAHAILQRAPKSLIHKQMHHLTDDVLKALFDERGDWVDVEDLEGLEVSQPVVSPLDPPVAAQAAAQLQVDRRQQVRLNYTEEVTVFRATDPAILPLRARDLSSAGLGIEPVRELGAGERVQIGIKAAPGDPPLMLWARAVVDGAAIANGLAFEPIQPDSERQLEWLTRSLAVEAPGPVTTGMEQHGVGENASEVAEAIVIGEDIGDDIGDDAGEAIYAEVTAVEDDLAGAGIEPVVAEAIVEAGIFDSSDETLYAEAIVIGDDLVEGDLEGDLEVDLEVDRGFAIGEVVAIAEDEGEAESGTVYEEAIVLADDPAVASSTASHEVDNDEQRKIADVPMLDIGDVVATETPQADHEPLDAQTAIEPELAAAGAGQASAEAARGTQAVGKSDLVVGKTPAGGRAGQRRKFALAASILLPLLMLAAWQVYAQLSQGPSDPPAAAVPDAPTLVASASAVDEGMSQAPDQEVWRQQTADTLFDSLDEDDSAAYLDAIRWLGELDPERTLDVLLARLDAARPSEEPAAASRRRALAAEALGMLVDPRAEQALRKSLSSDDQQVRLAAAKGLQKIRLKQKVDDLAVNELP